MIVVSKTKERRSLMRMLGIIVTTLVFVNIAYGGDNYTISGEVGFRNDGDINICILTLEKYAEFVTPGHELSKPECKYIRMNSDLKKAKQVSFKFENIPKGTYCIVSYQDENKNGKVDFENYLIKEPWGTYKEGDPAISSTWDMIKFEIEESISGIKIQM
jgi:uncharacterized protein (DUF2141 family)